MVITLVPQSRTNGLCVIRNKLSKYSDILATMLETFSKFSLATLPNTSSRTNKFGFGSELIFDKTNLNAK